MTVIAWDGCTLAADTALTSSCSSIIATVCKIECIDDNSWLAVAGSPEGLNMVSSWIRDGMPEKDKGHTECEWLFIRNGIAMIGSNFNLEYAGVPAPIVMGTGRSAALACMLAGKRADEAVRIACQVNGYCRMPMDVVDTKAEKPEIRRVA